MSRRKKRPSSAGRLVTIREMTILKARKKNPRPDGKKQHTGHALYSPINFRTTAGTRSRKELFIRSLRRLHNHIKTTILSFPPVARPVEAGGNPVISKLSGCRPPRFRAGMTNKSSFSTLLIFWRCHAWAASRIVKEGILQDGKSAGKS